MKTLFIEARKKLCLDVGLLKAIKDISRSRKLPRKVGLIATVQYISFLKIIKKELERIGKKVSIAKGAITKFPGQILGCDIGAAKKLSNVDAFLFVGSGRFHAEQAALAVKKPVFIWQPEGGSKLSEITKEEISKLLGRKKVALVNFIAAEQVGIIVSIKPGQENLSKALEVKKKLKKKGKTAFIFIADTINLQELENFSSNERLAWLNMACPALNMEPKILNLADLADII